jgi:hypothetical protein
VPPTLTETQAEGHTDAFTPEAAQSAAGPVADDAAAASPGEALADDAASQERSDSEAWNSGAR